MFEKFSTALLLVAGAIADQRAPECCSVFEGEAFTGNHSNLCLSRTIREESFKLSDNNISQVGSYWCGESTRFNFCSKENKGLCIGGDGDQSNFGDANLDRVNWLTLSYKDDDKTNLNLVSISEKSEALFKKLNLSSGIDNRDLPDDASAQWYSGLLYAYSYQWVDERDYIVGCTVNRRELDNKLVHAYNSYNDEQYKQGNQYMLDTENDFRRSMTDCCDTQHYFDEMVNKAHDFFDLSNWEDIVDQNYEANKDLIDNQNMQMLYSWFDAPNYFNAGMFYGRIWMLLAQGCMINCPEWPY